MVRKVPKKLEHKDDSKLWLGPGQAARYNYFVVFLLLCSYYGTDMINYNLELMFTGSYNFI